MAGPGPRVVLWPSYCLVCVYYFNYTQLLPIFQFFFLFALFSDEPEVFLPKYSQTAILHGAHFRRVLSKIRARLGVVDLSKIREAR